MEVCVTLALTLTQNSNTPKGRAEWPSPISRATSLPSALDLSSCSIMTLTNGWVSSYNSYQNHSELSNNSHYTHCRNSKTECSTNLRSDFSWLLMHWFLWLKHQATAIPPTARYYVTFNVKQFELGRCLTFRKAARVYQKVCMRCIEKQLCEKHFTNGKSA